MPRVKQVNRPIEEVTTPPAMTAEAQQNHMISLAINCAERQMRDGSASSAVICHYLKLASKKEDLEIEKAKAELELMRAKTKQIESQEQMDRMYAEAIRSLGIYKGESPDFGDDDDEEELY